MHVLGVRAGSNHGPYCGGNGATAEWSIVRCQFNNLSAAGTLHIAFRTMCAYLYSFIFC